jgi:hypothetical protein
VLPGEGEESEEDGDAATRVDRAVSNAVTELPPAWLDVTNALRFLVKDSHLKFHKVRDILSFTPPWIFRRTISQGGMQGIG